MLGLMTLYEILSIILEFGVLIVLLVEYFWGRPDVVIRNEANRKREYKRIKEKSIVYEKEMD